MARLTALAMIKTDRSYPIAKFVNVPSYFPIPDGKGHWISDDSLVFQSALLDLEIEVPPGSVNDLASIPWVLRRCFPINGPSRPAAALHDYLFAVNGLAGEGLYLSRHQCDLVFREAMSTPKRAFLKSLPAQVIVSMQLNHLYGSFLTESPLVDPLTVSLMYTGVRLGGRSAWEKCRKARETSI